MKRYLIGAAVAVATLCSTVSAAGIPPVITSPSGHVQWTEGKTYTIRWNSNGLGGNADINIYTGLPVHYVATIATNVPLSAEQYAWTIPVGLVSSDGGLGNGALTISLVVNGQVVATSDTQFEVDKNLGLTPFTDVTPDNPDATAIEYLREKGIVTGNPDGTYLPYDNINRASFTKFVTLSILNDDVINQCTAYLFYDVPNPSWYNPYLCAAHQHSLVSGYPDGAFRPADSINFAEAAKIVANAFVITMPDPSTTVWYEPYVRALASKNAIPVSIHSFNQLVTRGEMADMIYRLLANVTDEPSATYESLAGNSMSTDTWQTYTNTGLNYSFEYPSTMETVSLGGSAMIGIQPLSNNPTDGSDPNHYEVQAVWDNPATVEDWIRSPNSFDEMTGMTGGHDLSAYVKTTVDGQVAYRFNGDTESYIITLFNGYVYIIQAFDTYQPSSFQSFQTFDHLLSSFTFRTPSSVIPGQG